jgi:predicted RNA-binding Zn ribbon-like protein
VSTRYTGLVSGAAFRLEMGTAWLNLLTTLLGRRRARLEDAIATPADLARWLDAVGLAPRQRPDADDVRATHALRAHLYELARASADGTPVPAAAVRAVNEVLAADQPPRLRVRSDGLRAARPADTRAALARLARQAVDQLTSADPPRLRACGDDTCAGIFVDDTGRRRWCNDTRCGSRTRVRAHRARLGSGA